MSDDVTLMNPITGEVKTVDPADLESLARNRAELAELTTKIGAHVEAVDALIAAEMDRRNSRSESAGPFVVKVNAPKTESYDPHELREALAPLVEDGTLAQEAVDKAVVEPPPKAQAIKVMKGEVNKLKRSDNRAVLAALVKARYFTPQARKIEVTTNPKGV